MAEPSSRRGVLGTIRNSLVFFALALIIIEATIGLVVVRSEMTGEQQLQAIYVMAGLFFIVVMAVSIITFARPTHLYELIEKAQLESQAIAGVINGKGFRDVIVDTIVDHVSSDCLSQK